jgi:hypothetical protein
MNNHLKSLLQSYSKEQLIKASNYMPLDGSIDKWYTYSYPGDNGIIGINSFSANYYQNDGNIETIIDTSNVDTSNDFNILQELYQSNGPVRFIEPLETSFDDPFRYFKFKAPNNNPLGMPSLVEIILNREKFDDKDWAKNWIKEYIDQVGWIINKLNEMGALFPRQGISIDTRLKDDVGHYFYKLNSFDMPYDEFINEHLHNYLNNDSLLKFVDHDSLITYAELKWKK